MDNFNSLICDDNDVDSGAAVGISLIDGLITQDERLWSSDLFVSDANNQRRD